MGYLLATACPFRDFDGMLFQTLTKSVLSMRIERERIDGLIATAAGYAIGLKQTSTVVLGDLSALHDLNSLSLVANAPFPIVVVIINNQGGHIFDQLPIRRSQHFEQYFATPHGFHFEHAANMFDLPYNQIRESENLRPGIGKLCQAASPSFGIAYGSSAKYRNSAEVAERDS